MIPSSYLRLLALICAAWCCQLLLVSFSPLDRDVTSDALATKHHNRSKQLCRSATEYSTGRWVFNNNSASSFPYLSIHDDDEWGPLCTATQKQYQSRGIVPEYRK